MAHFKSRCPLWTAGLLLLCACAVAIQPPQMANDFLSYAISQGSPPNSGYAPQQPPVNSYAQPPSAPYGPPPSNGYPALPPSANAYANNYGPNAPNAYNNAPSPQNGYGSNNYQTPTNGNNYAPSNYPNPPTNQPSNSYGPPAPQPSTNYGNAAQQYGSSSSYSRPHAYKAAKSYSYSNTSAYEGSVAEAILRGYAYTLNENNNKAVVKLFQDHNLGLNINILLCNLTTNTYYSFYVHQYGELNNGCESTGPQYTSVPISTHPLTGLQTHPTGFVGFIKTNNESQIFQTNTKELNLDEIIGRSIVIHELAVNASALPTSLNNQMLNSLSLFLNPGSNPFIIGRRLACGVVGRANPLTFNRPANLNCEIELPTENRDIVSFNRVVSGSNSGSSAQPVSFPA